MENNKTKTITLSVSGMKCASCVANVEKTLTGVSGVKTASVNLITQSAVVSYENVEVDDLIQAVEQKGFSATLEEEGTFEPFGEKSDQLRGSYGVRLIISAIALMVFLLGSFILRFSGE